MKVATRLKAITLGVGLVLASFTATTEASTVLINQGSTTYDPTSGLDWLDLTASTNLQPREILAGSGGFVAAGWHYATVDEVKGLFLDAGIPALNLWSSNPNIWNYFTYGTAPDKSIGTAPDKSILALINILGQTGTGIYRNFAMGMLQGNSDGLLYYAELGIFDTSTTMGNIGGMAEIFQDNLPSLPGVTFPLDSPAAAKSGVTGSFLVRDHVDVPVAVTPLPAALPMFAAATGLMGFFGYRRRKNLTD